MQGDFPMKVLVVAGSKHGATMEIAGAVAAELRACGHVATALEPDEVDDVASYDAFVIGSAIYVGHWTKAALHFVRRHHEVLARRPVWLFSSGPLDGSEVPPDVPVEVVEMERDLSARGHELFSGALARTGLSVVERAVVKAVHATYGDFRDWEAVRRWSATIAAALGLRQ